MQHTSLLYAVLAGIVTGFVFLMAGTGHPAGLLLGYLSPLPMILIGMRYGLPAFGVSVAGTIGMLLFGGISGAGLLAFGLMFFLPALVGLWAYMNVLSGKGRKILWAPAGEALSWIAMTGVLLHAVVMTWLSSFANGFAAAAQEVVLPMLLRMAPQMAEIPELSEMLVRVLPYISGFVVVSWLFLLVANGLVAQLILGRAKQPVRAVPTMTEITTPQWLYYVMAASLFAMLFMKTHLLGLVGAGALIILILPYAFAGLGMIHQWLEKSPYRMIGLVLIYGLILILGWPIMLASLVGVLRPLLQANK